MEPRTKLVLTAASFAAALLIVAAAAAMESAAPLFIAFAPLLAVPWVLTRPGPGESGEDGDQDRAEVRRDRPDPAQ